MKLFRHWLVLIGIFVFMLTGVLAPASAKPFAINYKLTGELTIHKGIVYLNTADDRLFKLLMDEDKAREFSGQIVSVDGKAAKADEIEQIKVKKIAVIPQSEQDMPIVEYEAYQKAPELISNYKGEMKIRNVRWDISQDPQTKEKRAVHGWENCTIRPEKVLNAYFILKPFAPKFLAAHSLFVFTFSPGGMVAADGKESTALALSIEAHKKIGQTYGLIKTMKKAFKIVWLLTTWDNYANLNVNFNKSSDTELLIYPMRLTPEQTRALLEETIKQACVNREGEYYNTIRNNCTNNLAIVLNRVTGKDQQLRLWKIPGLIYNLKVTMPFSLAKLLKKRGFIGEPLKKVTRESFYTDIETIRNGK